MRYLADINEVVRNGRVAIYGAGSAGVKCKSDLEAKRPDVRVVCFSDSVKTGFIEHIPIEIPGKLAEMDLDEILVCSHKHQEIVQSLEKLGLGNTSVYGARLRDIYSESGLDSLQNSEGQFGLTLRDAFPQRTENIPCHAKYLFIQHDGGVYPCCRVRDWQQYLIGSVHDPDILQKISDFYVPCSCVGKKLRKLAPGEKVQVDILNIEFSLQCQASCAMCCVYAPEWRGTYDLYHALWKIFEAVHPSMLLVQGGEVLVQPETLRWLKAVKETRNDIRIRIVTNGNASARMAPELGKIFDEMSVSVVGFQPETYRKIMGLDIARMKKFVQSVRQDGAISLSLKYLCTPLNLHEAELFLDWAMQMAPESISVCDANLVSYINLDTRDRFWMKIIQRTAAQFRARLIRYKPDLERLGATVHIEPPIKVLFNISPSFIEEQGLAGLVA